MSKVGLKGPNPAQVRDWANGVGIRAKTDKQDAYVLARFAAERKPTPQGQVPTEIAELDSLLRRRDELEETMRQEKNRQKIYELRPDISDAVKANVQLLLSALQQALDEVEKAIQALLKEHPTLAQHVKLLQTVPGIGRKIVLPMLVLLHRWDVLTNGIGGAKGLTAFVGLDPKPHSSGLRQKSQNQSPRKPTVS